MRFKKSYMLILLGLVTLSSCKLNTKGSSSSLPGSSVEDVYEERDDQSTSVPTETPSTGTQIGTSSNSEPSIEESTNEPSIEPAKSYYETYLSDLAPSYLSSGWGELTVDKDQAGNKLSLKSENGEQIFDKGFFAHAYSVLIFDDFSSYDIESFEVYLGCNVTSRNSGTTSMKFYIYCDNSLAYSSDRILGSTVMQYVKIDFTEKINSITLIIDDLGGNGNDHGVWASPLLKYMSVDKMKEITK